jgi:hypothetical protein
MLCEHGSIAAAVQAMRDKGMDPSSNQPTRTDLVRHISLQLADMARKGEVERTDKGRALRWKLAAVADSRKSTSARILSTRYCAMGRRFGGFSTDFVCSLQSRIGSRRTEKWKGQLWRLAYSDTRRIGLLRVVGVIDKWLIT